MQFLVARGATNACFLVVGYIRAFIECTFAWNSTSSISSLSLDQFESDDAFSFTWLSLYDALFIRITVDAGSVRVVGCLNIRDDVQLHVWSADCQECECSSYFAIGFCFVHRQVARKTFLRGFLSNVVLLLSCSVSSRMRALSAASIHG